MRIARDEEGNCAVGYRWYNDVPVCQATRFVDWVESRMHPQISISAMSSDAPSWKERMAIALARDIIDGERIISGAHTEISFAAAMLARKMHAPNVKLQLGGTCFLVNVVTPYIFVTYHDRRTLVPKVDYISMPGPNGWRANNYPGHGPKWIITPHTIFTFDSGGCAQLSGTFAGTSVAWVRENTGFVFDLDPEFAELPEPTVEELEVLRSEIHSDGLL